MKQFTLILFFIHILAHVVTVGKCQNVNLIKDLSPGKDEGLPTFSYPYGNMNYAKNDSAILFSYHSQSAKSNSKALYYSTGDSAQLIMDLIHNDHPIMIPWHDHFLFARKNTLFITDGSSAGTTKIMSFSKDINSFSIVHQGLLYFEVDNNVWVTDATPLGTHQITTNGVNIDRSFILNNEVIFFNDLAGELYKTDGTSSGTTLLYNNIRLQNLSNAVIMDHKLYFSGKQFGDTDYTIWRSDGTSSGTHKISTLIKNPDDFTVLNGELYFIEGYSTSQGHKLWKINQNEQLVFIDYSVWRIITTFNNELYYSDASMKELWKVDTLVNQKIMLKQFSGTMASYGVELNGVMYFVARDGQIGHDVWRTDGTISGTQIFKDFYPGNYSYPSDIQILNNQLIIEVATNSNKEYWISDGTPNNTNLIKSFSDINYNANNYLRNIVLNNKMVFVASDLNQTNLQLWSTNGTSQGTTVLSSFNIPNSTDYNAAMVFELNNELMFSVYDSNYFQNLWISDGTSLGTNSLNQNQSVPIAKTNNNELYIASDINNDTIRINKYNGSALSTILPTFNPVHSSYKEYVNIGALTVIRSISFNSNSSVWAIDNQGNSELIANPYRGGKCIFSAIGKAFFIHEKYQNPGVYVSDGTNQGTYLLKHFSFDKYDGPSWFLEFNGEVYFNPFGNEIWKTDGTPGNAVSITSFPSAVSEPVVIGNKFYFTTSDVHGRELWGSDGTNSGTALVKDIFPGPIDGIKSDLIAYNNKIYFSACDSLDNTELWSSDGTASGTQQILDININGSGLGIHWGDQFYEHNGELYFTAYTISEGTELWKTDGTATGTKLVADINPGPSSSFPEFLGGLQNKLVFSAFKKNLGKEFWTLDNYIVENKESNNGMGRKMDIYPNPAEDYLNIGAKEIEISRISIFSSIGQLILSKDIVNDDLQVSVAGLPKGSYVLSIESNDNNIYNRVFIKK
ncbi:MAG: T9SS type A sorting domain-containing protein [Flavobacteriales bacterium]|nr:T9SS type A sorting domain-containing protein [Flavobacteriales bacterium]